jgi:hypothetical protein
VFVDDDVVTRRAVEAGALLSRNVGSKGLAMWRRFLLCAALALPCSLAMAQSALDIRRSYEGRGEGEIVLRTIVLDPDDGVVAADVEVAARGCGGSFAGIGRMTGGVLELRPYKAEEAEAACVISVAFDGTGKTATISETGCLAFHGAACAFEGKLTAEDED